MIGNILNISVHLQHNAYNAVVSWLTVLHLTQQQRTQLFHQSYKLLVNNGTFYCEDFVQLNTITDNERSVLQDGVFCNYISTQQQYIDDLQQAGYTVHTELLTDSWLLYSIDRATQWKSQYQRNIHIHGKDVVDNLQQFYDSIVMLFMGGNVGGIRVVATKNIDVGLDT